MKLLNKIIVVVFIITSVLVLLLSMSGYLKYEQRHLEFTSNFRLQYLLISFCTFFFWLLAKRYGWLVISLCSIFLNLIVIFPWYTPPQQQIVDQKYESVRVLVFNVLHDNKRYQNAINLVKNRSVDIAAFLEATPPWDTELLAIKDVLPYHFSAEKIQIEVYSRFPLNNPSIKRYGAYRGLVSFQVSVNQSNFIFVATHAYPQLFFGDVGWQNRNQQLEQGLGSEFQKSNQPVIIGGDLNVTMWSPYYRSMIANSSLQNARQGFGILPTFSVYFPQIPWLAIPLDHFLVSEGVVVTNMETGRNIGSDHLPILMDVLIPNQ